MHPSAIAPLLGSCNLPLNAPLPLPAAPAAAVASYNAASAVIAAAKRSGKASPSAADIQAQLTNKAFQFRSWGGRFVRFNTYGDLTQPTQVYVYDSRGATAPLDDTAAM